MWVIYGIKNCDRVKKARAQLDIQQINYRFHDYKIDGLDAILLQSFMTTLGLDAVINRSSTTWRQLGEQEKHQINSEQGLQLILKNPTLIKRPIIDTGEKLLVGFNPNDYVQN
ncbi:ArsC family reductase [Methylomonas sp. AM2-LC]|uniref:ArsC family reductase n=1 Tax=Methylomonas sp. AM2-LC TaxID=3153301 RepID=UPI0032645E13